MSTMIAPLRALVQALSGGDDSGEVLARLLSVDQAEQDAPLVAELTALVRTPSTSRGSASSGGQKALNLYSGLTAQAEVAVRSTLGRAVGLSPRAMEFLAEVAPHHFAAVASFSISSASAAGAAEHAHAHYCFQEKAFKAFTRFFQQGSLAHVPALKRMCLDLRVGATSADKADAARALDEKNGGRGVGTASRKRKIAALSRIKGTHLQTCEIQLKKAFSLAINDKLNDISQSRKWGALFVINQLLKIYFRLNLLLLCKTLVQAVDSRGTSSAPALANECAGGFPSSPPQLLPTRPLTDSLFVPPRSLCPFPSLPLSLSTA